MDAQWCVHAAIFVNALSQRTSKSERDEGLLPIGVDHWLDVVVVRGGGLEPPCLAALAPKASVSAISPSPHILSTADDPAR